MMIPHTTDTSTPAVWPPIGRHAGRPLPDIPADYLAWALAAGVRLSRPLTEAVRRELGRRGVDLPPEPPPPPRCCPRHTQAGIRCYWVTMRDGRRMIRGECRECGRSVGALPQTLPYTAMADAGTDPTALLEVMAEAERLGVEVTRRGDDIVLSPWSRVTPELAALARQARDQLHRLLPERGAW